MRKVFEETGLIIQKEKLKEAGVFYIRHYAEVKLHMFQKRFVTCPIINLNTTQHCEIKWMTIEEILKLPNITRGVKALQHRTVK